MSDPGSPGGNNPQTSSGQGDGSGSYDDSSLVSSPNPAPDGAPRQSSYVSPFGPDPRLTLNWSMDDVQNSSRQMDAAAKPLLNLVKSSESGGNYNARANAGREEVLPDLSGTSVRDVISGADQRAAGAYQLKHGTLQINANQTRTMDAPFNEQTQDTLASNQLMRDGFGKYLMGKITKPQFMDFMAGTYASLQNASGQGRYPGQARVPAAQISDAIDAAKGIYDAYAAQGRALPPLW